MQISEEEKSHLMQISEKRKNIYDSVLLLLAHTSWPNTIDVDINHYAQICKYSHSFTPLIDHLPTPQVNYLPISSPQKEQIIGRSPLSHYLYWHFICTKCKISSWSTFHVPLLPSNINDAFVIGNDLNWKRLVT